MPKVVTANLLATGAVVFFAGDAVWVDAIDDATSFDDAAASEAGLAEAKCDEARAIIVDPFIVDRVAAIDGTTKMTLRDTIRAYGPTIAFLPTDEAR